MGEEQIGFERADGQEGGSDDVETFREMYQEITDCRRGYDSIRTVVGFEERAEVWAMWQELKAVLWELGIPFPEFREQEGEPQWNSNLLHSLFLTRLAAFARLGHLEKARSYNESNEWKETWNEYAYGPPVGG